MNNNYITKILAEFDSLYEEQKEILDIPVCCTEEDCLCNKDTVWEHLKSFLSTSINQAIAEERESVRAVIDMGVKKEAKRLCFSERTAQIFWDGWGAGEEEKFIQRVLKENSFIADLLASLDKETCNHQIESNMTPDYCRICKKDLIYNKKDEKETTP